MFYMIRYKNQYLTMKPSENRTMYVTFKDRKNAHKCRSYINHHLDKYGKWPNFDMSKGHEELSPSFKKIKKSVDLYIEEKDIQMIDTMLKTNGIGIVYCHEFGFIPYGNNFTVNFTAQEIESHLDNHLYINSLHNIFRSHEDN